MLLTELLERFMRRAEELGLSYFVTGSVASSYFGEPRFTNDIDVVVDASPDQVAKLCEAFSTEDFYVDVDAARAAAANSRMFNILVSGGAFKIDVVVAPDTPHNRSRFARARRVKISSGVEGFVSSPEDVILSKLRFFKEGRSEKHTRDIATMLKVQWDELDFVYLAGWAIQLGVEDIWREILTQMGRADAFRMGGP